MAAAASTWEREDVNSGIVQTRTRWASGTRIRKTSWYPLRPPQCKAFESDRASPNAEYRFDRTQRRSNHEADLLRGLLHPVRHLRLAGKDAAALALGQGPP